MIRLLSPGEALCCPDPLTGCRIEPLLADAKPGERFQFVRTGYFTPDSKNPGVFIRTVTLKDGYKPQ